MIIDSLKNSAAIEGLNPYFKKIFDYVKSHDLLTAAPGKITIDGDNAYIMVSEVQGREKTAALLETHNRYIDIQILLKGEEGFGWKSRTALEEGKDTYNATDDICFYREEAKLYFTLSVGEFAVFFPEDAHAPCIGSGTIKKLVAKVKA